MRADAVLIKPDVPLVPTDASVIAEAAQGPKSPMAAWTYSDHGNMRTLYVFAYARDGGTQTVALTPSDLGVSSATYAYDVFANTGRLVAAGDTLTTSVSSGSYFIAAPIGPSGMALIGDASAFASSGAKRISSLADDGQLHATVEFATGESAIILHGYAPTAPSVVSTAGGTVDDVSYDSTTQRFRVSVHPLSPSTPSQVNLVLQ